MKNLFFFLSLFLMAGFAQAQTRVLEVDCSEDSEEKTVGPNRFYYPSRYFSAGWLLGSSEPGAAVKLGNSMTWEFGIRNKFKISGLLSTGLEFDINEHIYRIKQEAGKIFPDTIQNTKEWVNRTGLKGGWYLRINFDPHRGDHLGKYLDLGVSGNLKISSIHKTENDLAGDQELETKLSNLPYLKSIFYLANARIGFNKLIIFGQYRLTDILKPSYNYPDLPKMFLGIQFGI